MDNSVTNGHAVAKTICGTIQWAARQASNPMFRDIEFDQRLGTFRVTVDLPTPKPEVYEITATLVSDDGLTNRERLVRVAESFADLTALQARQRDTMAEMLRGCLQRLRSPDSRRRREGIEAVEALVAMLEGN